MPDRAKNSLPSLSLTDRVYEETSEYFLVLVLSVGALNLKEGRSLPVYDPPPGESREGAGTVLVVAEALEEAVEFPALLYATTFLVYEVLEVRLVSVQVVVLADDTVQTVFPPVSWT